MRDYALGTTFDIKFTTRRFSTGVPFTLAGSPAISAYPDNSTAQLTAGITLTVDFDSVTGLNNVRVVATSGNGYAAGSNYALVITAGTVDSVSVVGEVIGEFSIEAQSPLRPTTAARTLDVTATGAAGIDWANVENPTTALNLSATNIDVDQVVASVSGAVGSVTGAVGSVAASGISAASIASNAITSAKIAADAIGAAQLAADAVTEIQSGLATSAALTTVSGKIDTVDDFLDTEIAAILAAVDTEVAAIKAKTDLIPASPAATGDAMTLTTGERTAVADALLDRNMATGTDSGSPTVRTPRQALRALRNKVSRVGTDLTVTKEDDSTASWAATVTTDGAAEPIVTVDPA